MKGYVHEARRGVAILVIWPRAEPDNVHPRPEPTLAYLVFSVDTMRFEAFSDFLYKRNIVQ